MHFRAQRKLQGEVSLSEAIETDKAGNALYLQDVVGADDTMQEDLEGREDQRLIRRLVGECLTRPPAPDPAPGGRRLRHQPQLCLPHREAGPGEAGDGPAGALLSINSKNGGGSPRSCC